MRRKGVPCGCTDNGGCCGLKEKLAVLWDRTIGSILRINGVSPDGDGDFAIEAGDNINITETGTGNGLRIDTTGGVSYYESGDAYVNVDNNDLEITVNAGVTGGLALQDDLDTVTGAVSNILDGTTTVPKATDATNATNATNATYLGSNSANVGDDTKPIKIVNGQAVEVLTDLLAGKISEIWDSGQGHIAVKFTTIDGAVLGIETGFVDGTVPAGAGLARTVNLHNSYIWATTSISIASANPYYANIVPTAYRSGNQLIINVWNNVGNDSTQAFAWTVIGFVQ